MLSFIRTIRCFSEPFSNNKNTYIKICSSIDLNRHINRYISKKYYKKFTSSKNDILFKDRNVMYLFVKRTMSFYMIASYYEENYDRTTCIYQQCVALNKVLYVYNHHDINGERIIRIKFYNSKDFMSKCWSAIEESIKMIKFKSEYSFLE